MVCINNLSVGICLDMHQPIGYISLMQRTVRRELIDQWISEAGRDGITKLANKSGVPSSSISKIRTGRVPKDRDQREKLASALGVKERKLFPVLQGEEEQAS